MSFFAFLFQLALGDLNREPRPSKEIQKLMADMEAKHGK